MNVQHSIQIGQWGHQAVPWVESMTWGHSTAWSSPAAQHPTAHSWASLQARPYLCWQHPSSSPVQNFSGLSKGNKRPLKSTAAIFHRNRSTSYSYYPSQVFFLLLLQSCNPDTRHEDSRAAPTTSKKCTPKTHTDRVDPTKAKMHQTTPT